MNETIVPIEIEGLKPLAMSAMKRDGLPAEVKKEEEEETKKVEVEQ